MKCQECGREMEHQCSWVCIDTCWPCEYRKRPGMKPPGWTVEAYDARLKALKDKP